jgi:xanthine dehydrogenase YagS FAD-binding subunit
MAVAMVALDAVIRVAGPNGERRILAGEFHRLPGDTPHIETALAPGELITWVDLPPLPAGMNSAYLKVRDRASYEFALASAAVGLHVEGGTIRAARIALGGIATRPWRAPMAERVLVGHPADDTTFRAAADWALEGAIARQYNAFKIDLAKRTLVRALSDVARAA